MSPAHGARRGLGPAVAAALAGVAAGGCSDFAPWPTSRPDAAAAATCAPQRQGVELVGAAHITAAGFHTCARMRSGEVRCWGELDGLQYGCASAGRAVTRAYAVAVVGLRDAVDVAAGGGLYASEFDCARTASSGVRCWGFDDSGQRGDGNVWPLDAPPEGAATPNAVGALADVEELAAGGAHVCARLRSGEVRCWGSNRDGACGNAGRAQVEPAPVAVIGLQGAARLAAGGGHSCAALSDGTARCWGANTRGELGDGSGLRRETPVVVQGLRGAVQLAAGWQHTCALDAAGAVWCWGRGDAGQLGQGTTDDHAAPVRVADLGPVRAIAAGAMHTCALDAAGAVWCWGASPYDEAGVEVATTCIGVDGAATGRAPCALRPASVAGLSRATQLALGVNHSCALLEDGAVRCWGRGPALGNALAGERSRAPLAVER